MSMINSMRVLLFKICKYKKDELNAGRVLRATTREELDEIIKNLKEKGLIL